MSQAREVGGWRSAEAQGSLMVRMITITPASTAAGVGAQQAFAMTGMIITDLVVQATPNSAAQTTGVVVTPGFTSAAGQLGLWIAAALGTATGTAVIALPGVYQVLYFRR